MPGLERAARARRQARSPPSCPEDLKHPLPLHVSGWNRIPVAAVDLAMIRRAIRDEAELHLRYLDLKGLRTERDVRPLAVIYYTDALVLAAWCHLRQAFRHFRADRMEICELTGGSFRGQGDRLRREWERGTELP